MNKRIASNPLSTPTLFWYTKILYLKKIKNKHDNKQGLTIFLEHHLTCLVVFTCWHLDIEVKAALSNIENGVHPLEALNKSIKNLAAPMQISVRLILIFYLIISNILLNMLFVFTFRKCPRHIYWTSIIISLWYANFWNSLSGFL